MAFSESILLFVLVLPLWGLATIVYNLTLHPLAIHSGPRLWAATRLRWSYSFLSGRLPHEVRRLHEQYGQVIRVAPDELSIISPEAWNEIYGHINGRNFVKDPNAYVAAHDSPADHILIAKDADHARYRRCLSHAFSEKALREQQELVAGHVRLLMERLRGLAGQEVDMVRWYNYITFDMIGDLAFGESFGCLEDSNYHPWVSIIFDSIKMSGIVIIIRRYINSTILRACIPKSIEQKRRDHFAFTQAKVKKRLETPTDRADFLSYILRNNDEKGMTEPELMVNASLLILAGSETTATTLSGVTYFLLQNPEVLKTVTTEIRLRFKSEEDITQTALANCEYLNMVLKEGLRMYPPVAIALPRKVTADSVVIAGRKIPKGTTVGIPQWAAYYSSTNFSDPTTFNPSRWSQNEKTSATENARHQTQVFNPFSIGPRNCIGQNLAWIEMRLILASMLLNFDMELLDESWDPKDQQLFVLWSKPALNVKLRLAK